jgi:hypothetical protein
VAVVVIIYAKFLFGDLELGFYWVALSLKVGRGLMRHDLGPVGFVCVSSAAGAWTR